MSSPIDVLAQYIRDETGYTGMVDAEDDLLEKGILDSFNIVSLAMFAQERFGVEFDGDDLVRDNLARLSTLVKLIEKRRAEQS